MAAKRKPGKAGTRVVSKGPNKGDTVQFKVAPKSKKAYPVRTVVDRGPKRKGSLAKKKMKG